MNILHTEEPIEEAVKAGRIPFRATREGHVTKPQHPSSYVTYEDDSQSSKGDTLVSPDPNAPDVLEPAAKSARIVVSSSISASEGQVIVTTATPVFKDSSDIIFADLCRTVNAPTLLPMASVPSPASLVSFTSTLSPLSFVASPISVTQCVTSVTTPLPITLTPRPQPSPIHNTFMFTNKFERKRNINTRNKIFRIW